jgi:hypothetical protein
MLGKHELIHGTIKIAGYSGNVVHHSVIRAKRKLNP